MPSKFTTLLTSILALLSLQTFIATSPNQSAFAQNTIKYHPPGRVSPGRSEGSGTRSVEIITCPGSQKSLFLATLAPAEHIGQTSLARPTLYAYFTGTQALEIRLRQVGDLGKIGASGAVWKQTFQPKTPGFQAIPYPQDAPELITGKDYIWSSSIICNPDKAYEISGIKYANLTRVEEPLALRDLLKASKTVSDRAQNYANSSLWYEALDTLVAAKLANPKDSIIQTELVNLLKQVGLDKAARQEEDYALKRSTAEGLIYSNRIKNGCRTNVQKLSTAEHPSTETLTRCP